jgi:hypothetical protein
MYLAYDTRKTTAECSNPGNFYTNGIVSLKPDEISSVVGTFGGKFTTETWVHQEVNSTTTLRAFTTIRMLI